MLGFASINAKLSDYSPMADDLITQMLEVEFADDDANIFDGVDLD